MQIEIKDAVSYVKHGKLATTLPSFFIFLDVSVFVFVFFPTQMLILLDVFALTVMV